MATNKADWARAVLDRINSTPEGASFHRDAVAATTFESGGTVMPPDPFEQLVWLRSDEPAEAFEGGDPPQDYADFLTTEWDLYGPPGE